MPFDDSTSRQAKDSNFEIEENEKPDHRHALFKNEIKPNEFQFEYFSVNFRILRLFRKVKNEFQSIVRRSEPSSKHV